MVKLQFKLISARNLALVSPWGYTEPYAELVVSQTKSTMSTPRSAVKKMKSANPSFNQSVTLDIQDPFRDRLHLAFYDVDDNSAPVLIGETKISLLNLKKGVEYANWYRLVNCLSGDAHVALTPVDFDTSVSTGAPAGLSSGPSANGPQVLTPTPSPMPSPSTGSSGMILSGWPPILPTPVGAVNSAPPPLGASIPSPTVYHQHPLHHQYAAPAPTPPAPHSYGLLQPQQLSPAPQPVTSPPLPPYAPQQQQPQMQMQPQPVSLMGPPPAVAPLPVSQPHQPPSQPHRQMAGVGLRPGVVNEQSLLRTSGSDANSANSNAGNSPAPLPLLDPQWIQRDFPHIAKGSFGVVFKGTVRGLPGRDPNVKVVIKDMEVHNQRNVEDWKKEIAMMTRMRSPYVVEVLGYCSSGHILTIVMEYMTKGSLYDVLHQRKEPLSLVQRMRMARQCALSLSHLHAAGVIHRDIKSMNILCTEDYTCKLTDFGCAKLINDRSVFNTANSGTPLWMAPEVRAGQYDFSADIYSLGLVLYELFENKLPYYDQLRQTVILPKQFQSATVVLPCTAHRPASRPSAAQVVQVLDSMIRNVIAQIRKALSPDERARWLSTSAAGTPNTSDFPADLDSELAVLYSRLLQAEPLSVDSLIARAFNMAASPPPPQISQAQPRSTAAHHLDYLMGPAPAPAPAAASPPQQQQRMPAPAAVDDLLQLGDTFSSNQSLSPTPSPTLYPSLSPPVTHQSNPSVERALENMSLYDLRTLLYQLQIDESSAYSKADLLELARRPANLSAVQAALNNNNNRGNIGMGSNSSSLSNGSSVSSAAALSSGEKARALELFSLYGEGQPAIGRELAGLILSDLLRGRARPMSDSVIAQAVQRHLATLSSLPTALLDRDSFLIVYQHLLSMASSAPSETGSLI